MRALVVLLIFILFSSFFSLSQGTGITHYQRKATDILFQLPGDAYSSQGYLIAVPDSIYSFGYFTVKKAFFDDFKVVNYRLKFEENTIADVEFEIRNKSNYSSFLSTIRKRFGDTVQFTESGFQIDTSENKVNCSVSKLGGKYHIHLTFL